MHKWFCTGFDPVTGCHNPHWLLQTPGIHSTHDLAVQTCYGHAGVLRQRRTPPFTWTDDLEVQLLDLLQKFRHTWQQHMSPPTRMILDCRPGSPVTWLSPPTHMILDCRPGSPVTWQLHVTAHSYDTRLLTWQPSYLTTQLLGLPPKFEVGTHVTACLGYHPGGHLLALLRTPRNTTRRCWPITTTIQTIN